MIENLLIEQVYLKDNIKLLNSQIGEQLSLCKTMTLPDEDFNLFNGTKNILLLTTYHGITHLHYAYTKYRYAKNPDYPDEDYQSGGEFISASKCQFCIAADKLVQVKKETKKQLGNNKRRLSNIARNLYKKAKLS